MEPGPARIYKEMASCAKEMHASLIVMEGMDGAEGGLKRFEAALWKIDAIQDRAIKGAEQLAEAGEA